MSASDPSQPDLIKDLLTKPIPEKLWHYTSYAGLQGILESKKIFATDLRYLNDRQEFNHAKVLAMQLANEVVDSSKIGVTDNTLLQSAVNLAFNTGPLRADRLQVMVASFSEAEDQLSQWRGYSGASSGVSISFDLSKLRPPYKIQTGVVFAPCVYELSQKRAVLGQALSHFRRALTEWTSDIVEAVRIDPTLVSKLKNASDLGPPYVKEPSINVRLQMAMASVNFDLARIGPLLKDSSFAEEREWRLVLPVSTDQELQNHPRQYRPARDTLIPYIAYPFSFERDQPIPVNDVIIGPGGHAEAKAATSSFLHEHQIRVIPRLSGVPYRPW